MSERNEIRRETRPLEHPDSDPQETIYYDDGTSKTMINMLTCASRNCPATFNSTRKRAWHIQTAHPGEYSGPNEAMSRLSDVLKDSWGSDGDLGRTYTKDELE